MVLPSPPLSPEQLRHRRAPERLVFPEDADVPETQLHLELRTLLYQLLRDYLGELATVSSDQLVYWAADDPSQSLAPDACVRRGAPGGLVRSWKTWERGAPEVAVEIASDSDAPEPAWSHKLARYRKLGVLELLRFDPAAAAGSRLRVWDRVEGDLVERELDGELAPSTVLPLTWLVAAADGLPAALRFTAGDASAPLVPTRTEARLAAEQRIAELEAELKRRG